MTNVQFNEDPQDFTSRRILGEEVVPGMVNLLLKTGVVKDKHQAKYALLGIVITCILATLVISYLTLTRNESTDFRKKMDQKIEASMNTHTQ